MKFKVYSSSLGWSFVCMNYCMETINLWNCIQHQHNFTFSTAFRSGEFTGQQITGHHGPETRYFPVICLSNLLVDGGVDLGPLSTFLRMRFNTSTCNQPASFAMTFCVISSDLLLHFCQASSRRHNCLVYDWKAQETSAIILSQLS